MTAARVDMPPANKKAVLANKCRRLIAITKTDTQFHRGFQTPNYRKAALKDYLDIGVFECMLRNSTRGRAIVDADRKVEAQRL
jgi:hypothetical protein